MVIRTLLILGGVVLILIGVFGCRNYPPLALVPQVDMQRMMGTWYVTHHIPYWLEEGKVATKDVYAWRGDGKIDVRYEFRRETMDAPEEAWEGVAWVHDTATNNHWKVRFMWPFTADYLVMDMDPDYAWVVVGSRSRDYFWILSRTPALSPEVVDGIMDRAVAKGYDRSRFAEVPQPSDAPSMLHQSAPVQGIGLPGSTAAGFNAR